MNQTIYWENLKEDFLNFKQENSDSRTYDIAKGLNVPEAALFHQGLNLIECHQIELNPTELIPSLDKLGEVMSLVRNDSAVHEKIGSYKTINLHPGPQMATVLGPVIDQRIFYRFWATAYRFTMKGRTGELEGVAIFDTFGDSVMKLYKNDSTDPQTWSKLFGKNVESTSHPEYQTKKIEPNQFDDSRIDELLEAWANLKDTHDFYMLLAKFKVSRTHALQLGEGKFSHKLHNQIAVDIVGRVSSAGMPFMVFVGNKGIIQIHDGVIDKNFMQSGWFNIMDPSFNLHLDISKVKECWHVVKPTVDGDVNSIELYDENGEQIVSFFSSRKPGNPERQIWRDIIGEVSQNQGLI